MIFSSSVFIFVFLPFVLAVNFLLRKHRTAQNIFLFFASLIFYAWDNPIFVLLMLLSIILNWIFGILVDRFRSETRKCRIFLITSITVNLAILFVFKYLAFSMESIRSLFGASFSIPSITLPIGISFFTFQAMSYVIDVYREHGSVQKNPLDVGLYIAFFPQLIAGPIVRYETVAREIKERRENIEDFCSGVCRFIIGLGKKAIIANSLASAADAAFAQNSAAGELSIALAWIGALSYAFQIFFDFSGYSDMAIGLGRMFGFHFLENFNYPYISSSITEFWRRWHISLGTWFRDYLYIPLGGNRVKSKLRLVFNLFVVWLLTGIWHGANWTFIIWGLMYFVLLTFEKLTGFTKKHDGVIGRIFKHIYTLLFVLLGWVIFRAGNISEAFTYIKSMFGSSGVLICDNAVLQFCENAFFLAAAVIFSTPAVRIISDRMKKYPVVYEISKTAALAVILILSLTFVVKSTYDPFIYFNF